MATFHRSLGDDGHVTSSLVNGVVHYHDRQDHHFQDDHRQDHQVRRDHHLGDHRLVHQSRHRDDLLQNHQDDLVRHLGDRHRDHLDLQDDHQDYSDHQVRVCQDQMDALARRYLQDRDREHSQESDPFEHQHPDLQGDRP